MSVGTASAGVVVTRRRAETQPRSEFRIEDPSLWRAGDLRRSVVVCAVGLVVLAVCWWRASGESALRDQVVWLVIGIAATVLAGIGLMIWLAAGMRRVRAARAALVPRVSAAYLHAAPRDVLDTPIGQLVIGEAMTRAHRPTCLLVAGKTVTPISDGALADRGLNRCGVCQA